MVTLLDGLDGVIVYQNDILVFRADMKQYDILFDAVLERMIASGLWLNEKKCKIRQTSLNFLGHVIDKNGCRPDPGKVSAITELPHH